MSRHIRAWAPAVLWAAVLFAVSARPTLPVDLGFGRDKIAHFGAYLVLGFTLAYGAARSGAPFLVALLLGLLYAASDEFHQSFVPGRSADVADWAADALGVAAGLLLHHAWQRARRSRAAGPGRTLRDPLPND